jgi:hypothetical protein
VTSPLRTGKSVTFFYSAALSANIYMSFSFAEASAVKLRRLKSTYIYRRQSKNPKISIRLGNKTLKVSSALYYSNASLNLYPNICPCTEITHTYNSESRLGGAWVLNLNQRLGSLCVSRFKYRNYRKDHLKSLFWKGGLYSHKLTLTWDLFRSW